MQFDIPACRIIGPAGVLPVLPDDLVVSRLAMLIEGQCEGLGAAKAADKLGLSKQRYFQLLKLYREHGSAGLQGHKPGPKHNYVRTDEVERQVIRHRFLDPDASVDIIAQKLRQAGFQISTRSVDRVIEKYGLQKKNSTATARELSRPSTSGRTGIAPNPLRVIRGASSTGCDSFSPTRSWGTWPASGSWSPSCCA